MCQTWLRALGRMVDFHTRQASDLNPPSCRSTPMMNLRKAHNQRYYQTKGLIIVVCTVISDKVNSLHTILELRC